MIPMPSTGQNVTFIDGSATTAGTDPVLATGVCNGAGFQLPDDSGYMVPVFASRDGGRESTTVYVHSANLVSVS